MARGWSFLFFVILCIVTPLLLIKFEKLIETTIVVAQRYHAMKNFNQTRVEIEFPLSTCIHEIKHRECNQSKVCQMMTHYVTCDLKTYEVEKKIWVAKMVGYNNDFTSSVVMTTFVGLLSVLCTIGLHITVILCLFCDDEAALKSIVKRGTTILGE